MNISSLGVLASGLVWVVGVSACSSTSDGGSGGSGGATGGTSASAAGSAGKASTGGSSGSTSASSGGSAGASTAGTGGAATGTSGSGGGSSTESAFSCERTADGTCASYSSVPPNSASTYCSDGTVVTTCPTTDLQATCTFTSAGVDELFYYYTSGGHSNAAIKTVCDSESGVLKTF